MAIVQGTWNKLLSPGLVAVFKKTAEDAPIEYTEVWEQGKPLQMVAKYALGFKVSKEMIEDDHPFYRLIKVRELHVFDLGEGMLVPCDLVRDLFGR